MGLKITSALHTSKGDTSAMYINIENVMVAKNGNQMLRINRYLNKAARDANQRDTCDCFEVPINFQLKLSTEELAASNIFEVMYLKIQTELTAKGITSETL